MSGLMRYPCTACGGRGPHTGPGHAYTTEEVTGQDAEDSYVLIDDANSGTIRMIGPMSAVEAEACRSRLEARADAWPFVRKRVEVEVARPEPEDRFHVEWTPGPGDLL